MRVLTERGRKAIKRLHLIGLACALLASCGARSNGISPNGNANSSQQRSEEVVKYEESGVLFTVPTGWKANREGNKIILMPPDSSVTVQVYAPADRSMEEAMTEVDKTVKNKRQTGVDIRSTPIADGMRAQNFQGTGAINGSDVRWILTLVSTSDDKPLAILTYGDLSSFEKGRDVGQVIASLRKIK